MNLDDCISFILSILDNLIIKILNQENNNFNKCDKINNETIDSITLKIKDILKFIFESYLNISKQL